MVGGRTVLRACVTSFRTTEEDIRSVAGKMNALFEEDAAVLHAQPAQV
jgi:hypothetical protein